MEALALGVIFALGVLFIYDAFTRPDAKLEPRKWISLIGPRGAGAIAGAATAFLLTRWPMAGVTGAILGGLVPSLIVRSRAERERVRRMEAIAELAARLRDGIRSGIGIHDALSQAAARPPVAIASDLRRLAADARVSGMSVGAAAFSARLGPDAELLTGALSLGEQLGARNTSEVLDALAETTSAKAATLREARARQTKAKSSARIVAAVPLLLLLAIRHSNPAYLVPYNAFEGQLVLTFALALIGLGYAGMLRAARLEGRSR